MQCMGAYLEVGTCLRHYGNYHIAALNAILVHMGASLGYKLLTLV